MVINQLQMKAQAEIEIRRRAGAMKQGTVVGFVSPDGELTHCITNDSGEWLSTDAEPEVYLAEKLEPVVTSTKRFIVVIGGRGSTKSVGIADTCIINAKYDSSKTYCLREFQSSIKNSVHSLLKDEIDRLEFNGFEVLEQTIRKDGDDVFQFAGISRNVSSIKSAHGFRRFFVEEAQFLSQASLDVLTPTARNKPNKGLPKSPDELEANDYSGVSMVFVANPESSEDPFSQRFIVPFQDSLDRDGFYEDDLHLIVVMNYVDNPWFMESGLEVERAWAKKNTSTELYEHVWLGGFNDSVDNGLIDGAWFDACIDAHEKLGFKPAGAKIGAHDPSDTGDDSKGYAERHGCVVTNVMEMLEGNVNDGGHWACEVAIASGLDYFTYDADGMGVALNEQISTDLKEKKIRIAMFKGSESPDTPEAIYKPAMNADVENQKQVKDVFRNKRSQYYVALRDRIYRTYRAVVLKEYHDPETLISFSSDIKSLKKLRAELCRMPVKDMGNGFINLYTKQEMKRLFGFKSPNLGDSVMMLMRYESVDNVAPRIPRPIRPMPLRRR